MAVIIRDEFTATDGTLINGRTPSPTNTPGAAWSILIGAPSYAKILTNRASFTYNGVTEIYAIVPSGVADCVITSIVAYAPGSSSGLLFRVTDSANYWIVRIRPTAIDILERTSGTLITRASTGRGYTELVPYTITLTLTGNSISATCDGSTVAYSSAIRSSETTHGLIGLGTYDNFEITGEGNAVPVIMDYYRRRRAR